MGAIESTIVILTFPAISRRNAPILLHDLDKPNSSRYGCDRYSLWKKWDLYGRGRIFNNIHD